MPFYSIHCRGVALPCFPELCLCFAARLVSFRFSTLPLRYKSARQLSLPLLYAAQRFGALACRCSSSLCHCNALTFYSLPIHNVALLFRSNTRQNRAMPLHHVLVHHIAIAVHHLAIADLYLAELCHSESVPFGPLQFNATALQLSAYPFITLQFRGVSAHVLASTKHSITIPFRCSADLCRHSTSSHWKRPWEALRHCPNPLYWP